MSSTIEEDFELELRSLPGVVNVGMTHGEDGDVESVVLTIRNHDPEVVRESAIQVASLYFPDAAVILEEASTPRPDRGGVAAAARIALEAAEFNDRDGVSEVRLGFAGRVGVGRAGSGPLIGGAEATLGALPRPRQRHPLLPDGGDQGRHGDRVLGDRRPALAGRQR